MPNTVVPGKLGTGIIITDADRSNRVVGVVLIDPLTGLPLAAANTVVQPISKGQVVTLATTIAINASITPDIDLGINRLSRIEMPAAWTAAGITLQTSADNIAWNNLHDKAGNEYTVTAAAARSIILSSDDMVSIRYLRIRSGTAALPILQIAVRSLVLVLLPQ